MTKALVPLMAITLLLGACAGQPTEETVTTGENPLFSEFDTPYGAPPFDSIENAHYMPAFEQGMDEHMAEVLAIAESTEPATFENTVEALEYSGKTLSRTAGVFYNLNGSTTNEEMQAIAKEIGPKLAKHRDDINLNEALFARVQAVWEQKDSLELDAEQGLVIFVGSTLYLLTGAIYGVLFHLVMSLFFNAATLQVNTVFGEDGALSRKVCA